MSIANNGLGGRYLVDDGYAGTKTKDQAPAGMQWDQLSGKFTPIVGSASDKLAQRTRSQGMQDKMFARLMAMGDASSSSSASAGGAGGSGGVGGTALPAQVGPVGLGGVGEVDAANSAAQAANFGKAKATAGSLGRSAMSGLDDEMASRGIMGSGTQGRGIADRLAAATNPLSDINAAQLGENANTARHNQDLGADAAKTSYAGGITQRGQDIQANDANAKNQLAAQQIAAQKQQAMMSMMSRAVGGLTGNINANLSY